jgi:hypothetical protein
MASNDNKIADGIPMSLEQMRIYLQGYHGIPIVLRQQGTTAVKCVYCGKLHEHMGPPGHYVAGCDEKDRLNGGVAIGQRYFTNNYGYTVYDYKEAWGINELIGASD